MIILHINSIVSFQWFTIVAMQYVR